MRIAFMGTPAVAVPALRLLAQTHDIELCVTAPPRPRGRGRQVQQSDVGREALALGLPVITPERLNGDAVGTILERGIDAVAVVAYGRILPAALFDRVPCLNLHPSLLPLHRGAAPVPWTIWSGDENWGVTIMRIVRELDAGPILMQEAWPLGLETAGEILELAAERGARMLGTALERLGRGELTERMQEGEATYARMLTPLDERLDFSQSAAELARQVRALSPRPGVRVHFPGHSIEVRLLDAEAVPGDAAPGALIDLGERIGFGTGRGILATARVQPAGRGAQSGAEFLRGRSSLRGATAE